VVLLIHVGPDDHAAVIDAAGDRVGRIRRVDGYDFPAGRMHKPMHDMTSLGVPSRDYAHGIYGLRLGVDRSPPVEAGDRAVCGAHEAATLRAIVVRARDRTAIVDTDGVSV
jgi:hypothetical protein